jgi:hypothetical protein
MWPSATTAPPEQLMSGPSDAFRTTDRATQDMIASTRRGVVERMADPYLTDHDRWVLRQFAYFLNGVTPDPDPRLARVRSEEPLSHGAQGPRV